MSFDKNSTVGFVYGINGEIYGIDLFHNTRLFADLWPKLLDAIIVEAISEELIDSAESITSTDILTMIERFCGTKTQVETEEINSETTYTITSTDSLVKFETFDKRENNQLLHVNYITVCENDDSSKRQVQGIYQDNIPMQQNRRR